MAEKLFTEFPPVSTAQWEEVITKDLKGADYEKKLVWKTYDGFAVRPYYRAEDLQNLAYAGKNPGEFPFVKGTKQNTKVVSQILPSYIEDKASIAFNCSISLNLLMVCFALISASKKQKREKQEYGKQSN